MAWTESEELLVQIVEIRSRNLMWGLFRDDDALDANRVALERIGDAAGAEELRLNEAMLLTHIGRPLDALALLDEIGEVERPRARSLRAFAGLPGAGRHRALRDGCRRSRVGVCRARGVPGTDRHAGGGCAPDDSGVRAAGVRPAWRGDRAGGGDVRRDAGHRAPGRVDVAGPRARTVRLAARAARNRPPLVRRSPRPQRGEQPRRPASDHPVGPRHRGGRAG